jgi:carbon storage regulator
MLVLSRNCDTEVHIGSDITIRVLAIHKRHVKLGIDAPTGLSIWRAEIFQHVDRNEHDAAEARCCKSG